MFAKVKNSKCSTRIKKVCASVKDKVQSGARNRKQARIRKCIHDLLQLYDPEKISSVEQLMSEWKNNEMQLLQTLHQKYHLTDVGLTYFKSKYSRLYELPSIYKGTFCRQCIRRSNGEQRLYHRLYKKRVSQYLINEIKLNIDILRKFNHKNIIKLYDVFESRTRIVLITDLLNYDESYLPMSILNKARSSTRPLNEAVIAHIFDQMVQVIQYLHIKEYLHLNINMDSFIISNWDGNKAYIKLIRVDQCKYIPDLVQNNKLLLLNTTDKRFAAPETVNDSLNHLISTKSDIYSLGILLYTLLSGDVARRVPLISVGGGDDRNNIAEFEINYSKNHEFWNHLSYHARDLILKLTSSNIQRRICINNIFDHPWINRYRLGYLHSTLWSGYNDNLYKFECILKLRNAFKKLLIIKDCLGELDDMIPVNDLRIIINNWSNQFEKETKSKKYIVPLQIKEIIVDYA